MIKSSLVNACACLLLCALAAAASAARPAECETPTRLRFSIVPEGSVQRDMAAFQPLFDELQAALGIPVEVVMPSSYGSVIEGLLAGAIDLARLGPASYVSAKRGDPAITAFATYAKKAGAFQGEGAYYHSMLVVSAHGTPPAIAALRGKNLALVDPDSTSGALIPRKWFPKVIGVPIERYFGRVSYAGSHDEAVLAVLDKRVAAAFVASTHLSALVRSGKARPEDFKVLWQSAPIPTDPFVYRGQLCRNIKEKIHAVFLGRKRKSGDAVLDGMAAVRFVPVSDRDYQPIRELSTAP
jgi:phosphonate transport system substrate-binding protein